MRVSLTIKDTDSGSFPPLLHSSWEEFQGPVSELGLLTVTYA